MDIAKIMNTQQCRDADAYSIKKNYTSSWELMERASNAFVDELVKHFNTETVIAVLCGPGNNGGDGLAVARILRSKGYQVTCYFFPFAQATKDCQLNLSRLNDFIEWDIHQSPPSLDPFDLVIDALLGSGLSRPIEEALGDLVQTINNSDCKVLSIDIPSGLFGDQLNKEDTIVACDLCITFERPKLSFFLPENNAYIKEWKVVQIGLDHSYIQKMDSPYYWLDKTALNLVKERSKFTHKGTYGHGLLIAGSFGKMGAAILAARAALRSGIGLLTTRTPRSGVDIMQIAVPESMLSPDPNLHYISKIEEEINVQAIGIGPGLGQHSGTIECVIDVVRNAKRPLVIDADALNILSKHRDHLEKLSPNSILTPHPKEFERLVGTWSNSSERLEKQMNKYWKELDKLEAEFGYSLDEVDEEA